MAKRSKQVSHDSSDDEAPEAVSFGTSKKTAKGEQDALQQHHASQKQKKKEKNRAIDRALKDRSANAKGKGKAVGDRSGKVVKKAASPSDEEESGSDDAEESTQDGPSRKDLEERMARAMMEAEGESGSEEDDEEFTGFGDDVEMDGEDEEMSDDAEESGGEDDDEDEESLDEAQSDGDEDENEGMGSEDEDDDEEQEAEESTRPLSAPRKDDYLPDHLFEAALSHTGKKIVFDEDPLPSPQASRPQKRQRTKRTSEDILLGCAYTHCSSHTIS